MMVYKQKRSQPFRWVLALILFILAMTITFDGVDGFNLPNGNNPSDSTTLASASVDNSIGDDNSSSTTSPAAIPEPATLLLLAGGLGTLYAVRKFRSKN